MRQGPHQVAQKSTSTTLPRRSESLTFLPSGRLASKSGACWRSECASGLEDAAAAVVDFLEAAGAAGAAGGSGADSTFVCDVSTRSTVTECLTPSSVV